jgi:uncharacterized membrane protein YhaH (DUF805 family)
VTISPDGQWFWNGVEWIPAPPSHSPSAEPTRNLFDDYDYFNINQNIPGTRIAESNQPYHPQYSSAPVAIPLINRRAGDSSYWNMPLIEQLTGFSGRINRQRYIFYSLFILFVQTLVFISVLFAFSTFDDQSFWAIVTVSFLPFYIMYYSLTIQRLQDTGKGGPPWHVCVVLGLTFSAVGLNTLPGSDLELYTSCLTVLFSFIPGIICLFERGNSGPNEYGPDPLGY